jgi:hypothetical protein
MPVKSWLSFRVADKKHRPATHAVWREAGTDPRIRHIGKAKPLRPLRVTAIGDSRVLAGIPRFVHGSRAGGLVG